MDILYQARIDWEALREFRAHANRATVYADGKQWDDFITDPNNACRQIREKEYIQRNGQVPLIQMSLLQDISGVHGAIDGQDAAGRHERQTVSTRGN
jgi:hypothetical protein